MSESKNRVTAFSGQGRTALNAGARARAVLWAALVFGGAALAVELVFLLRGHRVPPLVLAAPLVGSALAAVVAYTRLRHSHERAVGHLDRFFGLKEGLITADEHIRKGRSEEIHELQIGHTARRIEPHDPVAARPHIRRRWWSVAAILIVTAAALLLVDDSAAVKAQQAEEQRVSELSTEMAEELREELDDLIETADPELKELIEEAALREKIAAIEGRADRRAVMRALSEIARDLSDARSQLDTRADRSYLKALAEQLAQSRETAEIAEALKNGDYRKAADAMDNMALSGSAGAAEREALEKLAARIDETEKSMSGNESGSRRDARGMSREIKKMSQEAKQQGQCSDESRSAVNEALQQSGSSMRQVQARSQAEAALGRLGQQLGQCRSRVSGEGRTPGGNSNGGQGQQPGGEGWGEGVDRSRRDPEEKSPSEGRLEHLSGILGEGESQKVIEETLSGSGTATAGDSDREAAGYERQVEAFVRRDDVPEEMKHGVKTYFETIHELEQRMNEGADDGK